MKFKKLTYKNFQSVGNIPVEIDFEKNHTTLIGGMNGAGKSSVLEALVWVLTNKTLKKTTLQRLINNTNKKNLEVTLTFEKNGNEYLVVRGMKPNIFEIYKNGEILNQDAANKDLQSKLEFVTGLDYNTLAQMIVLNLERFKPFMEMTASERRTIVEEILNITIFGTMLELQKKKIKETDRNIQRENQHVLEINSQLLSLEKVLRESKESDEEYLKDLESKISSMFEQIESYKAELTEVDEEKINTLEKRLETLKKQKISVQKEIALFQKIYSDKEEQIKFFENGRCPTCHQSLENADRSKEIKDEMQMVLSQAQESIDEENKIDETVSALNNTLISLLNKVKANSSVQSNIRTQEMLVASAMKDYESLVSKSKNDGSKIEADIEKLIQEKEEHQKHIDSLSQELETQYIVLDMVSDKGVKQAIIRDYIEFINYRVNDYLSAMDFYLNIRLDESFNESFKGMKEGMVYADLSTGQKRRVNLAIWLALTEVSSMKNSVVANTVFLDEILENLDSEGIQLFVRLLKEKMPEKHIFVITQRFEQFRDLFDGEIYFTINEGFTEMK